MRCFPSGSWEQLELDKVRKILSDHCRHPLAKEWALQLPVLSDRREIAVLLSRAEEYRQWLLAGLYFPNEFYHPLTNELKLLSIGGAVLDGAQLLLIRKLADNMQAVFRWFDEEKRSAFRSLAGILDDTYYEKTIIELIDEKLDASGKVMDHASEELLQIRTQLSRKRMEVRRHFDRMVERLNKKGYLSEISESFMNGRRVLAVFAEHKRMVKGVLHSESDSGRTSFIEPEETTELNNEVFSLEHQESKEVYRILRKLTSDLSLYATLLIQYQQIAALYDLNAAKAKFALEIGGCYPHVQQEPVIHLMQAYHPLLLLYNKKAGKNTLPVSLELNREQSILVISGPNAGGKTVTLKTVALLQAMLQSGLLVPVDPASKMGVFQQLMMHIGDTQSIEFELSTYSSQLKNMKHFTEHADGRTLFFIDELGSGSDPNLGGAFAEVILEKLADSKALGIVTTHYLNLKVMAASVEGMVNGAMQFDEKSLMPLYQLSIGKPGSSYTFAIAERIGLDRRLIQRARSLVDQDQFRLDKLLNSTETQWRQLQSERDRLKNLIKENEILKKEMQQTLNKEKHRQEVELLRQKNRLTDEKLANLRDLERKLKALVIEWRREEDKSKVIKMMHALLFRQKEKMATEKQQKKFNEKFEEIGGEIAVGNKVKMKQNRQVGTVREIRGKKLILQLGTMPVTVDARDVVLVREKPME